MFVFELENGALPEDCAERAGFSGGTTNDPEKRRANLKSAASKAASNPRIKQLREAYRLFRAHGDVQIAPEAEVLQRLTQILRASNDAAAITGAKTLLEFHKRSNPAIVGMDRVPALVKAACSHENILMQVIGIAAGRFWKLGVPSMKDWKVPVHLETIARLMDRAELSPREVVEVLLLARGSKPPSEPVQLNGVERDEPAYLEADDQDAEIQGIRAALAEMR